MCGVCGCGNEDGKATISVPQKGNHLLIKSHNVSLEQDSHNHSHAHEHGHHHHHGENDGTKSVIDLERDILHQNQMGAEKNRGYFEAKNMLTLNLVSSPGSGKTSLLEKTLADLKDSFDFYVIEGDQQTLNDANRIDALNIPVVQVNTGKGCHLESDMIYDALKTLKPKDGSILMIENVGNLVCPSMFDLGEHKRVVIISITEGEDKPIKYPDMFHGSQVCIINKMDLQPYLNTDVEKLKDYARQVNPNLIFFEVAATTGLGMEAWYQWLEEERGKLQ